MTTANLSTRRQRELVEQIQQLVELRARDEVAIKQDYETRDAATRDSYEQQKQRLSTNYREETESLRTVYAEAMDKVIADYEQHRQTDARRFDAATTQIKTETDKTLKAARRERLLANQRATEEYERQIGLPGQEFANFQATLEQYRAELVALDAHARGILSRRRCAALAGKPADPTSDPSNPGVDDVSSQEAPHTKDATSDTEAPNGESASTGDSTSGVGRNQLRPLDRYAKSVVDARQQLQQMTAQKTAKYLEEGWPFLLFLFVTLLAAYPCILALGWNGWQWIAATVGVGVATTLIITLAVYPFVRRQTAAVYPSFERSRVDSLAALQEAEDEAQRAVSKRQQAITQKRDKSLQSADEKWEKVSAQIGNDRESRLNETAQANDKRKRQRLDSRDQDLQQLNEKYPPLLEQRETKYHDDLKRQELEFQETLAESKSTFDRQWCELVERWTTAMADFRGAVEQMNGYCSGNFQDWAAVDWTHWSPPEKAVEALRFGDYAFDLATLENGVPTDDDLAVDPTSYHLPACLSFPECPSLLLQASDAGRDDAVRILQNVMLRLLTSAPAGKVRFTIIDPTGLGQNFSAFMHLADFDDKLVTNRIWTESGHINKRLLDLTEHMEKVIQKYLRNEFESIQEYNEHAGEVAEPFQILVVANFPTGFTDEAARRLASIAASGARCGVYTLISTDQKLGLPRNFDLADLEAHAANLEWDGEKFRWKDPVLSVLPLSVDVPPDDNLFTTVVKAAGREAKDSSRVEVPFATVVPATERWWTDDSRSEIGVPLGRAGATKFQYMRLGRGTSQHVLISGKTGSGKSTLLHALITNLALHYSPSEVEFYLIDFKKGVEFRPYAAHGLPHARVVAIESEREFGMSVLERLDEELKRRGDLFRAQGVQNVAGYRDANPDAFMPRVLLIIDEFQELFVKDDKLAQDASLLMDRLVRQGRAFGIHVLLGSQTLAGAYSLARSTIGQMAVRVALQCSEADAHLILSEDNTAARLLSRPGEAIYNDANGLLEGNHPFQVVWLPDSEREYYLREVGARARDAHLDLPAPIVFEGNVPADPSKNEPLRGLLESAPESILAPQAWLGAAVAIKEPTAATFRRQAGSNLLLVGQQEDMALGVMSTSLISLASQMPTRDAARFCLLDGTHPDAPQADFWSTLANRLPLDVTATTPRGVAEVMSDLGGELQQRMDAGDDSAAPVFLLIHNLSRFRDLKKSDDDFGFSMDADADSSTSPSKHLSNLLRDGPAFGIHVLMWCDTYNNVNRWIDRQSLRDLEMRVLFQMGATDSSNLMDSPEASRLGVHRAILYSEELGQWEKFRPYGPPTDEWLGWVRRRLENRWAETPTR